MIVTLERIMILYSSLSNNLGPLLYRVEFKLSLFLSFESIKRPPSNITNINYLPWLFQICARAKSAKFCQHYPYSDCNVCYNNDHLWWYLELIVHNIISIWKIEIEINDTVIALLWKLCTLGTILAYLSNLNSNGKSLSCTM